MDVETKKYFCCILRVITTIYHVFRNNLHEQKLWVVVPSLCCHTIWFLALNFFKLHLSFQLFIIIHLLSTCFNFLKKLPFVNQPHGMFECYSYFCYYPLCSEHVSHETSIAHATLPLNSITLCFSL